MTETGSRLLFGVAAVLAGTTVLLGVFGLVYNPVLLLAAVPFAAATYFLWSSATGRLDARMRERVQTRRSGGGEARRSRGTTGPAGRAGPAGPSGDATSPGAADPRRGRRATGGGGGPAGRGDPAAGRRGRAAEASGERTRSRSAAASVLGVDPAADEAEIRRAFREKARELHPDAPGGDEAAFRRVRTAYETLTESR